MLNEPTSQRQFFPQGGSGCPGRVVACDLAVVVAETSACEVYGSVPGAPMSASKVTVSVPAGRAQLELCPDAVHVVAT
jgi:hypothetical protein